MRLQIPDVAQFIHNLRKEINGTGANFLPLIINSMINPPPPNLDIEIGPPQLPDITLNIPGDNYSLKDLLPVVDMSNVTVPGPIDISKIAPGVNLHPNMTNLSEKLAASLKPNITLPTLPKKLTKPNITLPKISKPNLQIPKVQLPNLGLNKPVSANIDLSKLPIDKKTLSALLSAAQHQG